ncbi:MAG: hypothetical protein ACD_79C00650G0011 [uncultured bacterium]|nr:MAG: hypothetical protein ACD_79C00650G0011 [uncultured bacterium]
MDDFEKRKQIEHYVGKLQNILSKVITESKEFQELKKLASAENSEIQFCIFSILGDKSRIEALKSMDIEALQKIISDYHDADNSNSLEEAEWTDEDRKFLKGLNIIF